MGWQGTDGSMGRSGYDDGNWLADMFTSDPSERNRLQLNKPVAQRGRDGWRSNYAPSAPAPNSLQALYAAQQAQQNPYGQQYIQGAQTQAQLAFGGQQQALSGALAGRGMMGSGQEVAQRSALGGAQARSLLDIAQNAQNQGINWQQQQNNRLFDMAQGIESNKFARDQFDWQKKQAAYNRQRQEEQDQYSWIAPVATIAGAALAGPFGAAAGNALGNAFQPDRRYYS